MFQVKVAHIKCALVSRLQVKLHTHSHTHTRVVTLQSALWGQTPEGSSRLHTDLQVPRVQCDTTH